MLRTEIIEDRAGMASLYPAWDALHCSASGATPYNSPLWTTAWMAEHVPDGRLRVVAAFDAKELVGIMPLYREAHGPFVILREAGLQQVNGEGVDVLLKDGVQETAWSAIVDAVQCLESDACLWYGLRSDSALNVFLLHASPEMFAAHRLVSTPLGRVPVIELPDSFDAYMQGRSRRFRKHFRQETANAERLGVWTRLESEDPHCEDVVQRLLAVEDAAWQGKRGNAVIRRSRGFFAAVLPELLRTDRAQVVWAERGGHPIAYVLMLLNAHRAFFHLTAYRQDMAAVSPGALVHYRAIAHACERGVRTIDFMTDIGSRQWKDHWSTYTLVSWRQLFIRRTLRGRVLGTFLSVSPMF